MPWVNTWDTVIEQWWVSKRWSILEPENKKTDNELLTESTWLSTHVITCAKCNPKFAELRIKSLNGFSCLLLFFSPLLKNVKNQCWTLTSDISLHSGEDIPNRHEVSCEEYHITKWKFREAQSESFPRKISTWAVLFNSF